MPVIPGGEGSQVLNPGSPVPVASSEDDRAFGNALSYLGNALMEVGKRTQADRDKLMSQMAVEEYRDRLIRESISQKNMAPLENDATGQGAADAVFGRVSDTKSDIVSRLENDRQRMAFLASSKNLDNDKMVDIVSSEVKKRAEYNDILRQKLYMDKAGSLRTDPTDIENVFNDIEASILGDDEIPTWKKPDAIRNYKRMALREATNGLTRSGAYASAEAYLNTFAGDLYDAEEKEKLIRDVDGQYLMAAKREEQLARRKDQITKEYHSEVRQKKRDMYTALLNAARNDITTSQITMQDIMMDPDLTSEDKEGFLKGKKSYFKDTEDAFETNIITEFMIGPDSGNIEKLVKKVDAARGKQISDERATSIKKYLKDRAGDMERDPGFSTKLAGAKEIVKSATTINLGGVDFNSKEGQNMYGQALYILGVAVSKNPGGNFEAMAHSAVKTVFGAKTASRPVRGLPPNDQSPPMLRKRLETLAEEATSKGLSPARKKEIATQVKEINRRLKELSEGNKNESTEPKQGAPRGSSTESVPPGVPTVLPAKRR